MVFLKMSDPKTLESKTMSFPPAFSQLQNPIHQEHPLLMKLIRFLQLLWLLYLIDVVTMTINDGKIGARPEIKRMLVETSKRRWLWLLQILNLRLNPNSLNRSPRIKSKQNWKSSVNSTLPNQERAWKNVTDGSSYEGQILNGVPHGFGKQVLANCSILEGVFKD